MEDNIVKAIITADDTNTLNNDINVESSQNNITKSIISNNNGENILETMILPVNPRTQEHQQYLLYVPVATAGRHIGISSYDDDDFIVNDKGFVKLALSRQSIVQQFSDVNLKIDNEISRATNTESTLNLKINNETSRAREAESRLSARIEEINADMNFDNYYNKNEVDELFVTNTALEEKHYATEDYVNLNGGKIDVIKVNSIPQEIVDKTIELTIPSIEGLASETFVNTKTQEVLIAANKHTDDRVSGLIGQAPETLDTLKEIADALAEDQTALDTLNLAIGNKVNKTLKINGKTLEQDINLTAADVGALSNFTETDPTVPSHVKNITTTDISNWNNKLSSVPSVYKTKTENDALYQAKGNYLTSFTETDPTVPAWAKEPTKPSYNYSEINNTPTIPTVNNSTITIKQGEEIKGTFTLNQSNDSTIELDAGGGGSSITLYETTGQNTDGAMTQKATTDELNKKVEFEDFDEIEFTPGMQTQLNNIQNQINNIGMQVSNKADKSQWISVEKEVSSTSTVTIDLTNVLPDSSSNYEILFSTWSWGANGTWVASSISVSTSALTRSIAVAGDRSYGDNGGGYLLGNAIIPVLGTDRKITVNPANIGTNAYTIVAYRRIY